MKKKIFALAVVVAMLALAVASATMAYFTDDEFNRNVVTVGDVDIRQDEVFDDTVIPQPGEEVEKEVTVTNVGDGDAYIRTLIAFEDTWDSASNLKLNFNCNCPDGNNCQAWQLPNNGVDDACQFKVTDNATGEWTVFTVGYFDYTVAGLADSILPAGESVKSLDNFMIKADAGNDFAAKVGETLEILVLTQAVQTGTFETAEDAFAATFDGVDVLGYEDDVIVAGWFQEYLGDGYTVVPFYTADYDWSQEPTADDIDEAGNVTK